MHACDSTVSSSIWHPISNQLYETHTAIAISEKLLIHEPTFPIHVCYRKRHSDSWQWIGSLAADDSCQLKVAKLCRYVRCDDTLKPGPCEVLGIRSNVVERTPTGSYLYTRRPTEPSASKGIVIPSNIQGTSSMIQRACAAMACSKFSAIHFEQSYSHKAFVASPDGMESRFLYQNNLDSGDEIFSVTNQLDSWEYAEITVSFVIRDFHPSSVQIGFVQNGTQFDEADSGRFYNTTATPLQFGSYFNSSKGSSCDLSTDVWYRIVIRFHPSEISIWPDQYADSIDLSPTCYLRRPTDFVPFDNTGWRMAFVITIPNAVDIRPVHDRSKIILRP